MPRGAAKSEALSMLWGLRMTECPISLSQRWAGESGQPGEMWAVWYERRAAAKFKHFSAEVREMCHRRREGSRRASACPGTPNQRAECISRAGWLVHSAKRDRNRCSCRQQPRLQRDDVGMATAPTRRSVWQGAATLAMCSLCALGVTGKHASS